MFNYDKLWTVLKTQKLKKIDLKKNANLTPATLAKLGKNEFVSMDILDRLCTYLECDIGDIIEHVYTPYKDNDVLGTFLPNKSESIHSWFGYLEGYSKLLVESELEKLPKVSSILDPFGGSGTTPLVAITNGIDSFYAETNPVMAFIIKCKTTTSFSIASDKKTLHELKAHINEIKAHLSTLVFSEENIKPFGGFEKYFESQNLFFIQAYQTFCEKITNNDVKDIFRLALASVGVASSKMIRRGDLRFAKGKEILKTSKPFVKEISSKLDEIFRDLSNIQIPSSLGKAIYLSADARNIKEKNLVDAIITSPPYLNGTNYIRNTKLELKLLNFVATEQELSALHRQGIVAGINNVSRGSGNFQPSPEILPILKELEDVSYDKRIPQMITGYFNDMENIFLISSQVLKNNGHFIMDIGDSQFAGVHVPTHEVLKTIAGNYGFVQYSEDVLRHRKSKSGFELTQRLLRFSLKK